MDYFLNMTDCLRIGQLNGTDFRIVQETACYIFLCLLISSPSLNKSIFFQQSQEALPSVWAGQLSETLLNLKLCNNCQSRRNQL